MDSLEIHQIHWEFIKSPKAAPGAPRPQRSVPCTPGGRCGRALEDSLEIHQIHWEFLKSPKAAEQGEQDGAKVSLSSDAMFVAELRDKIGTTELRTDLIAETKAEIAIGTLETNVDRDQVIVGLLGDL